jgi:hypothetical protein
MAGAESAATRELLQRQRATASALLADIAAEVSARQLPIASPKLNLWEVEAFVKELRGMRPATNRSLMKKASLLLEMVRPFHMYSDTIQ